MPLILIFSVGSYESAPLAVSTTLDKEPNIGETGQTQSKRGNMSLLSYLRPPKNVPLFLSEGYGSAQHPVAQATPPFETITIGRDPACTIIVPAAFIKVSRQQALFQHADDGWQINNLGKNRVGYNHWSVEGARGKYAVAKLRHGDIIFVGAGMYCVGLNKQPPVLLGPAGIQCTAEKAHQLNRRLLQGDVSAVTEGHSYYVREDESVGGNSGPECYGINLYLNQCGQIMTVGNIQNIPADVLRLACWHSILRIKDERGSHESDRVLDASVTNTMPQLVQNELRRLVGLPFKQIEVNDKLDGRVKT